MSKFKQGDFITFDSNINKIHAYICRVNNEGSYDYIRDTLNRWSASKELVEKGNIINKNSFIIKVKYNAEISGNMIPSTKQINCALNLYKNNFEVNMQEIYKCFNN